MSSLLTLITTLAAKHPTAITALTLLVTTYLLLYRWQFVKIHPDEPPIVPSAIPFVGHVLGMAIFGGRYVKNLGLKNKTNPLFTLPLPRSRLYIVTDPLLASSVQRAARTLSFTPLVPRITQRVLGLDDTTVAIVQRDLDPAPGMPRGFLADVHDLVYGALGPGEELGELSLGVTKGLARGVEGFVRGTFPEEEEKGDAGVVVDLMQWIRHFVTVATAELLYGEENPIALDPELEAAFWDFDHGLGSLLMGVWPAVTARRAYRGREALVAALEGYLLEGRYLQKEGRKGASGIVQRRIEIALRHGWTMRAVARSELSFLFAGIVNTATTTFWMVLYLFADRTTGDGNLLSAVRSELNLNTITNNENNNNNTTENSTENSTDKTPKISLTSLKTASPTLHALFREALRHNSDTYSTRLVTEPTTLSAPSSSSSLNSDYIYQPQYHLTRHSVVQISGGTIHADPRIWGKDVSAFRPGRFLPSSISGSGSISSSSGNGNKDGNGNGDGGNEGNGPEKQIHPASFRAFGGGKTLCPGRHFATATIEAFVAVLAGTFEIEGVAEGDSDGDKRRIEVPGKEDGVLPVHVLEPKKAVLVRVRVRKGMRGRGWGVAA